MRIKIMPTKSLGCCAVARTPASPTIPIAIPAASPLKPTDKPEPRAAKPWKAEYPVEATEIKEYKPSQSDIHLAKDSRKSNNHHNNNKLFNHYCFYHYNYHYYHWWWCRCCCYCCNQIMTPITQLLYTTTVIPTHRPTNNDNIDDRTDHLPDVPRMTAMIRP